MTLERRAVFKLSIGVLALGTALADHRSAWAGPEGYAQGDMALGAEDAPVTIVEYASMTCPHCASFHRDTFKDLKGAYLDSGKARLIYREFPLDRLALQAAMVARCAGPDRFFPFIDVMFRRQDSWSRSKEPVEALAKLARLGGMSREDFDACLKDEALIDTILKTRLAGSNEFGINSTPSFVINGQTYPGAMSLDDFKRIIDPLLPGN